MHCHLVQLYTKFLECSTSGKKSVLVRCNSRDIPSLLLSAAQSFASSTVFLFGMMVILKECRYNVVHVANNVD